VSATASSGLAVSFSSTTTSICTVAGATVTLVTIGTCTIQAIQAGNAVYAAATPVNQSFQVIPVQLPTSYQYTGHPFNLFTCGLEPNSTNITVDCTFTNPQSSYTTADSVTATLTLAAPLAPNLVSQDVSSYPGFTLTMHDGLQTLTATTPVGTRAVISTDPAGNIIAPWDVFIDAGGAANNSILTANDPAQPSQFDWGFLTSPQTGPANGGLASNSPGVWSAVSQGGISWGAFTRVNQFDSSGDQDDIVNGGLTIPLVENGTGSQYGQNFARANFEPLNLLTAAGSTITLNMGPAAGAWSDSNLGVGSGRGLAFATFNAPPLGANSQPIPFKVNAILEGQYDHDVFGLPDGTLSAAAQVMVVDTALFTSIINAPGRNAAQFLMGGPPGTTVATPATALGNLHTALASAILPNGYAIASPIAGIQPLGTRFTLPVNTGLVTVAPGKQFTIIFDVSAYTAVGGFVGWAAGTGDANFLRTLQPAANLFTDANGNPIAGITGVGSEPPAPPTPAGLTLTSAVSNYLAGQTASVTAKLTDSNAAPMRGTVVLFKILSGPNAGLNGGGLTNANGEAVFSYIGKGGAGTDVLQASLDTLLSNTFSDTWTVNVLPSGGACNGTFDGTFSGTINITAGQNCNLIGGRITGNIAQTGGSLSLSNLIVGGNVLVQGTGSITTGPSVTINGNVLLQNIVASAAPSQICGTQIQGNATVQTNAAAVHIGSASCGGNLINGNLAVLNNAGATTIVGNSVGTNLTDQGNTGPTQVSGNTVGSHLACQGNTTITGGGNTAAQKQGQCSTF